MATREDADKLRQRYGGQWFKGGECTHPNESPNLESHPLNILKRH